MFKALTILIVGLATMVVVTPSLVADDLSTPIESPNQIEDSSQGPENPWQVQTERELILQMPIEERPNRPGHFYGNSLRRIYYGRIFVNRARGLSGPLGF